ncbi:hypothetical protein [Salinigranum salinum]|uniref:hypothetical protein n=1 Tax=Salinigranum salinum TaxID=1364937 RepID=UPI001261207C|nr:hypothetical protein [Salinigranum salinum]
MLWSHTSWSTDGGTSGSGGDPLDDGSADSEGEAVTAAQLLGLRHRDLVRLLVELCTRLGAERIRPVAFDDRETVLACEWIEGEATTVVVERDADPSTHTGTGRDLSDSPAERSRDGLASSGRPRRHADGPTNVASGTPAGPIEPDLVVVATTELPETPRSPARARLSLATLADVLREVGADDLDEWVQGRTRAVPQRPLTLRTVCLGAATVGRLAVLCAVVAGVAVPVLALWFAVVLWATTPTLLYLDSRGLHAPRGIVRWLFVAGAAVPLVGILVVGVYGARRVERYEYVPDEAAAPVPPSVPTPSGLGLAADPLTVSDAPSTTALVEVLGAATDERPAAT